MTSEKSLTGAMQQIEAGQLPNRRSVVSPLASAGKREPDIRSQSLTGAMQHLEANNLRRGNKHGSITHRNWTNGRSIDDVPLPPFPSDVKPQAGNK